jgi:hypothetical protein
LVRVSLCVKAQLRSNNKTRRQQHANTMKIEFVLHSEEHILFFQCCDGEFHSRFISQACLLLSVSFFYFGQFSLKK